jgi:sulfhydrogenase subunit gamma (sulfur reductase)
METRGNIYLPARAKIRRVVSLSADVKLFTLGGFDGNHRPRAGQFFMVSVMGAGEVPISAASAQGEPLSLCIRKVGKVTAAIHELKEGDILGIRGPYGNAFPSEMARDRDVIFLAGGIGIAPLRPLIQEVAANAKSYGKVFVLYGAKTPEEIIFKDDLEGWAKGTSVALTVDSPDEEWQGRTGVVTGLLDEVDADFSKGVAFVCGPEVMIKASLRELASRGMPEDSIITTLEAHMKCGVGKCGHCYLASKYICTDGPVFTLRELRDIWAAF